MSDLIDRLNAALEGRYAFEHEIGSGGMATVYLADDLRHGRKVAIKVLKPELAAVVGAERFLAEIRTTANLQHPHILPLHDSGEAEGFLYFVMPYIEGETLRERLDREKQLPVDEAVGIATAVAAALSAAHEQGVVHRDIKPANILLSRGEPLVADFGIALAVSEAGGGRLTETGLSVGTPYYMSPEQATGDRDISAQSDVYALGCVLYEMLVGEPPYTGNTAQAVLGKILTEEPRSPATVRSVVPANIEATVLKALEKLPADRFPSASGFVRALSDPSFRYGAGVEAPGVVEVKAGFWKPLAVVSMVAAVAVGAMEIRRAFSNEVEPVLRFELTSPPEMTLRIDAGVNIAVSPDGSQVVFVASTSDGGEALWLRRLDRLEAVRIPGTENARNPRFSPDGGSIAFTANDALTTVSLGGAPPLRVVSSGVPNGGGGVAWGTDGYLYYRRASAGVWRVPENGGDAEEVTALETGILGHSWIDALPNGNGILFTRTRGTPTESQIAVLSLETGEVSPLLQGAMARYARSGHIVFASGDGALLAAPFDLDRLETTGPARPIMEGIQVNTGSASYFAVSASGTLLYLLGTATGGGVPTWVMGDGSEELLSGTLDRGVFNDPRLSPDGRKVAFAHSPSGSAGTDIWIYDIDQGTFSPLTFGGDGRSPFWRSDGSEVGFVAARGGGFSLYARSADFSGEPRQLVRNDDGVFEGAWTPDGEALLYRTSSSGVASIYHVPDGEDAPSTLVSGEGAQRFTVAPDGRWIAFQSSVSGTTEVYVVPSPGPGGRRQVSVSGGSRPVWSRDGTKIFYRTPDQAWWVARVRTEPDFAVEDRQRFANGASLDFEYDVSAEGDRILAIQLGAPGGVVNRPVVVTNWFQELRERVGS